MVLIVILNIGLSGVQYHCGIAKKGLKASIINLNHAVDVAVCAANGPRALGQRVWHRAFPPESAVLRPPNLSPQSDCRPVGPGRLGAHELAAEATFGYISWHFKG